jgi:hypothetical protein
MPGEVDPVAVAAVDLLNDLQETLIGDLMADEIREGGRSFLLARPDFRSQAREYLELCNYAKKPASQMATALRSFLRLPVEGPPSRGTAGGVMKESGPEGNPKVD